MADTITSPTTTPEAVLAAAKKMLEDGLVEGTSGNISGRLGRCAAGFGLRQRDDLIP